MNPAPPTGQGGTLETSIPVRDYDLAATLASGQAFGWTPRGSGWESVIHGRWVRLAQAGEIIHATAAEPQSDWGWLREYLQTGVELEAVLRTFPDDDPMRRSVAACRGLRLLRQDPWECLASFILSSTKQIVQIQQIHQELCARHGSTVATPEGVAPRRAFPTARETAAAGEPALRACRMGFRAPNLHRAAEAVASGGLDLESLRGMSVDEARQRLCGLRGVGPKIANCVLLFAYGFPTAFPVDVWVFKAIRQLYFPKRRPTPRRLERFVHSHFGPNSGYAQQYLFHYMRTAGPAARGAVRRLSSGAAQD